MDLTKSSKSADLPDSNADHALREVTAALPKSEDKTVTPLTAQKHADKVANATERASLDDLKTDNLYKQKEAARPKSHFGNIVRESHHTTGPGETLLGLSRHVLGQGASNSEVDRYAETVASLNAIENPNRLHPGINIKLPGYDRSGSITFEDSNRLHWSLNYDGQIVRSDPKEGKVARQKFLDNFGSYEEKDKGPKPTDNSIQFYINKDHYTLVNHKDETGNTVSTGSDGFHKVTDKKGNWTATYSVGMDPARASYDAASGVTTQHYINGTLVKLFEKDNHSEALEPNGTRTSNYADGSSRVEYHDSHGTEFGYAQKLLKNGSYEQNGWGSKPQDNYEEHYDSKTGVTARLEAKGTPLERHVIKLPDGTTRVEAKDGRNVEIKPDGSEKHWGRETFTKPPFDYAHDSNLSRARDVLDKTLSKTLPGSFKEMQKDMFDFEARAQKVHISPEEIAKTYTAIDKLMATPDTHAAISMQNRELITRGLLHQLAKPQETDQGQYNTCNVTVALKQALHKSPSTAAEMATSVAVTGQWRAEDGHVVKIDKLSLQPQAQERVYPPAASGDRTFATQILNLVMVNDQLQRRPSPESYVQRTPDRSIPNDTGERRLNQAGKVITTPKYDGNEDSWRTVPDAAPGLTDREVAKIGARVSGDFRMLGVQSTQPGVDNIVNERHFIEHLTQLKNQGHFPVGVYVDANHTPIEISRNQRPGFGAHFVMLDHLDEKTGRVHVSNQWGQSSNRWVSVKALYENASGAAASSNDGVDTWKFQ